MKFENAKKAVMIVWIMAIMVFLIDGAKKEKEVRQLNISMEISDEQYHAMQRRAARVGNGQNWTVHDEIRNTAAAAILITANEEMRRAVDAKLDEAIAEDFILDDTPIMVTSMRKEVEVITPTLSEDPKGEPVATDTIITETDLDLFARCVEAEAGNQSFEGKTAAAEVIRIRIHRSEWPNTVREVIAQEGQFSVWATGAILTVTPDEETVRAVVTALSGSKTIPEDYVFFNTSPIGKDCIQIGDHYFGR